jgi:hypothetical protein
VDRDRPFLQPSSGTEITIAVVVRIARQAAAQGPFRIRDRQRSVRWKSLNQPRIIVTLDFLQGLAPVMVLALQRIP